VKPYETGLRGSYTIKPIFTEQKVAGTEQPKLSGMPIQKAIEILTQASKGKSEVPVLALKNAVKLSIEALKAHLKARTPPYPLIDAYLPGETED